MTVEAAADASVARLTRLRNALRGGGCVAQDDALALVKGLDRYLAGEPFETAFGLMIDRGSRSPRTVAQLAERDALLCEAAAKFFPDGSKAEKARRLHEALSRYETSGWRFERGEATCPDRHVGRVRELFWKALKANPNTPSVERLRKVLVAS
jgi:hypothetical protein